MEGNTNPKCGSPWKPARVLGEESLSSMSSQSTECKEQRQLSMQAMQVPRVLLVLLGSKQGPLANSCWIQ